MDQLAPGSRVQWNSLNGTTYGIVERIDQRGVLVRLNNNKCVLADERSLKH